MTTETLPFQAEVGRVLHLVVHSLYTHKEIFLRELLSNASDAIDKLRFRALTEHGLMAADEEPRIRIAADPAAGTLTISDDGVGMTRAELVENLGTVASSGTRRFLEAAEKSGPNLIGSFGVGFYSSFLVADRVRVVTRAAGASEAWAWASDGQEEFSLEPATRSRRGTDVVLHLKDEQKEFLHDYKLKTLVRSYSDFLSHPIELYVLQPKPIDEDGKVDREAPDVRQWERVNQAQALWRRPKSEISAEDYQSFYEHLSHDHRAPLAWTHFQVEGRQSFTGLLYVPERLEAFELQRTENKGIRLFVRRVFVTQECKELLPEYLRFLRGLIDSDDLPLNVSRETLQFDRVTAAIRKSVTKKALDLLEELASEETKEGETPRYEKLWRGFGALLKEGLHDDFENRDRLLELLRFPTTHGEGLSSLAQYKARMKEGQEKIYYLVGDSLASLRRSPYLEALSSRGYEVLLLDQPGIDDWVVGQIHEYQEQELVSAAHGDLALPEKEAPEEKPDSEQQQELLPLVARMKEVLSSRVKDVRISKRLTGSPCCLVADEGRMSATLERAMRAHDQSFQGAQRVFEINPSHPLIANLRSKLDGGAAKLSDWTLLLYDQALLAEGSPISDPAEFARRMTELLTEASARA
ncbi:MAG: molecular chaperone HtpG [Planctomycetes bacterium]|nr:molecular chaperone HtpG [Planctomycetota bacterium]